MSKRIFSRDPVFGVTKYWHYDESTDQATIETVQDSEALLDRNVAEYNEYSSLDRWREGLGRKVASIPMTMYAELIATGKIHDQKYLKQMLNDISFRKLRAAPGRV